MNTGFIQEEFGGTEKPVNQIRPLMSVRLLTFNNCAYISQSIDSALMQVTNFPFEIVIGEDDSTDGTREICIDYARRYPDRIRLFLRREQDKIVINGTRTSRHNFVSTLAACRAPFISLLDGDDYWTDPSKLQKEIDEFTSDPSCAMVFHDAAEANASGRILRKSVLPDHRKRNLSAEELSLGAGAITSAICFRNVIQPFPDEFFKIINGDIFLMSLLGKHGGANYLPITPTVYRLHLGSMFGSLGGIRILEFSRLTRIEMIKYYKRSGDRRLVALFQKEVDGLSKILDNPLNRFLYGLKRNTFLFQVHYLGDWFRRVLRK